MERTESIRGVLNSEKEMPIIQSRYLIALIVIAGAALSLPLWLTPNHVEVKNFVQTDFAKLLAAPLFISVFLERALEVFVTAWRGDESDRLSKQVQRLKKRVSELKRAEERLAGRQNNEENAADSNESSSGDQLNQAVEQLECAEKDLTAYKCLTRKYAHWLALILGILVSAAGIRTLQPLIEPGALSELAGVQAGDFHLMDVLLTGGLIAGGSEGIHKLTQLYKETVQTTSIKIKKKRKVLTRVKGSPV